MSIREMVAALQREARNPDELTPSRAAEALLETTALMGNCRDEARKREVEYAAVELDAYRTEKTANRAKLLAKTSPQFVAWREAQDTFKQAEALAGSFKYYLRNCESEMRLAR